MARDIEEFLRRAAERRKQAQQGGGGQKRPPAQRPAGQQPPQRQPAQRQPPQPPPRQTISQRDVVKPVKFPSIGEESVEEHVARHLDVSDIVAHVDELAEDIEQSDERMEAHLDQVFDHEVGRLTAGKSATDELHAQVSSNRLAEGLLKMLQNPKTVRQSIMIAEILKRPDFDDE